MGGGVPTGAAFPRAGHIFLHSAASVTSRALRGVFWHVHAWRRRQEARLPCLRPRACGRARQPARLGDAPRGSSSSRPATSEHGSSLDGSLPSMLWACCTASPTLWEGLQGQGGPARARLRAQYYHDYLLSNRAADGGLVRRAARRQAAPHPSDSICCLASLAATASGGLRRPPRFASAAYRTAARTSARRPRRPRRARIARRSSGECQGG